MVKLQESTIKGNFLQQDVYGCISCIEFFSRRPDVFDGVIALSGLYHAGYFFSKLYNEQFIIHILSVII